MPPAPARQPAHLPRRPRGARRPRRNSWRRSSAAFLKPPALGGAVHDPPAMPYENLGDALATDYFYVREEFSEEQWQHFLATRRFVDTRGAARHQPVLGGGRTALASDAPPSGVGPARRGHRRVRLSRHDATRPRAGQHGAAPGGRKPRHLPRRPVRTGHEVHRPARLGRPEATLATGHGPPRRHRRLRLDRADARVGLGIAGDHGPPSRARLGARRRQSGGSATGRSPTSS